ncbi:MAG: transcriptional repressor [Patescibacteria group bacterium]
MPNINRIKLKQLGFRVTPARLNVLEILTHTKRPLDAVEIQAALRKQYQSVDQVTVYRMLEAFSQKGIVVKIQLQEGKFRYELPREEHHHLICDRCGVIQDVKGCPIPRYKDQIAKQQDFQITRHSLEFFGKCHKCQNI